MENLLTEKQQKLLEFIGNYQLEYGISPTIREMREYFGVNSDNSILKHLKALEEKGKIQKDESHRGIKILNTVKQQMGRDSFRLPLLGYIPAGGPVLTEEYIESWMEVSPDIIHKNKNSFLLKVKGDSMIEAGIFEGDILVVCSDLAARPGDIVVALVDNENTVKRYMYEEGVYYLKPENSNYSNIYPNHSLQIQGVVTALLRFLR